MSLPEEKCQDHKQMTKMSISRVNLKRGTEYVPSNIGACVFRQGFSMNLCTPQHAHQGPETPRVPL